MNAINVKWHIVFLCIVFLITASVLAIYGCSDEEEQSLVDQVKQNLESAATAQDSFFTDNDFYTVTTDDLEAEGWNPVPDIMLIIDADSASYCLEAVHDDEGSYWSYDSDVGLREGAFC
jgi:hypothetical protein